MAASRSVPAGRPAGPFRAAVMRYVAFPPSPSARQAGFTLVELVLVIVIVGILAVVMAPRFHDPATYSALRYAEELRAAMRHAQKLALASGCRVQLTQDTAGFLLQRDSDCLSSTNDFTAAISDPLGGSSYSRSLPAGVALLPAAGFSLIFDARGTASADLVAQIGDYSLTVTAATGLVQ